MTAISKAQAVWRGTLPEGSGTVSLDSSGAGPLPVSWEARAEGTGTATTPEELIGAAHSSCFSMALSSALAKAGTPPETLETTAEVTFQPGQGITGIHLTVRGQVPGIDADAFQEAAEGAKKGCPVSQALTGTTITLDASLA